MGIVGRTLGRYRLLEEIGSGGFATVYLGLDTRQNEPVAVKVLLEAGRDATALSRFEREAQALRKLPNHPNIVGLRDYGKLNGYYFLVMEYVSGTDLSEELHRRGKLPVVEAVDITVQIASALDAALAVGIVHRDIKPDNIRLLPDHTVKLLDFGIAHDASRKRITQAGLLAGTSPYVAPEVWQGRPADHYSDIYSLGCVLYEMLVGRPPFSADAPEAIMRLHLETSPDLEAVSAGGAPAGVCDVLDRMLAKAPAQRPSTGDLLERLPPYGPARKGPVPASSRVGAEPTGAQAGNPAGRPAGGGETEKTRVNLRRATASAIPPRRNQIGWLSAVFLALAVGCLLGAALVSSLGLPAVIEWRASQLEPTAAAEARLAAELFRGAQPETGGASAAAIPQAGAAVAADLATPAQPDAEPTTAAGSPTAAHDASTSTATVTAARTPTATVAPTQTAAQVSTYSWIPGRLRRLPNGQPVDWFIDDTSPGLTLNPPPGSLTGQRIWGRLDYIDQADYGAGYYTIRAGDTADIVWTMDVPLPTGFYELFIYRPMYFRDFVAESVPYEVYLDGQRLRPFAGSSTVSHMKTRGEWVSIGGYEIVRPGILSVRLDSEAAQPVKYEVDIDALGIARLDEPKLLSPNPDQP